MIEMARMVMMRQIDDISMQSAAVHGAGCEKILPWLLKGGVLDSVQTLYLIQKYRSHKVDNSNPVRGTDNDIHQSSRHKQTP